MTEGLKNDQDLYDKVDYSLVPLELLEGSLNACVPGGKVAVSIEWNIFGMIHKTLNKTATFKGGVNAIFGKSIVMYGIKPLATALGIGVVKYERDNWKKFDSDPDRFLRAALRHLMAIMSGDDHDHEEGIEGYPKGNDHRGAVCFALMVADNIINKNI